MELKLERANILQLDLISKKNTLCLLPVGKSRKQKLVIGDDSGHITCYEFKKGEPQIVFQTKFFDEPITSVTLGGTGPKLDRIFISQGQRIIGMTKKGKEFFKLTTQLAEQISKILIDESRIYTAFEYIFNLYDEGLELAFFINRDVINDVLIEHISGSHFFDTILACQDNCIRILQGSQCILEIPTLSPVTAVNVLNLDNKEFYEDLPTYLIFGMESGSFGLVSLYRESPNNANASSQLASSSAAVVLAQAAAKSEFMSSKELFSLIQSTYGSIDTSSGSATGSSNDLKYKLMWVIDDSERRGSVTCIKSFELRKNALNLTSNYIDIIIGRDDGRLQVYSTEVQSLRQGNRPRIAFTHDIEEKILSVACGLVNSTEYNEIVVAGYSGKIVSFTTEPVLLRAHDDSYGRTLQTVNNENRIKALQKDIEALSAKLEKEREKVKKISSSSYIKPPPDFSINSKFLLDPALAAYLLTVELQNPIDILIIRSPVQLDFIETGSALISITPPALLSTENYQSTFTSEESSYKFVAAFRNSQSNDQKRLSITIRSTEGEFGDLLVTVVTVLNANTKAAKVLRFPLKPLSLHSKVYLLSDEQLNRPRHFIKFSGQIAMTTAHEWVQNLLTDIPPRLSDDIVEEKYFFRHTFTDSITLCEFRKNELIFESESASTIVIVKENISKLASARRLQIDTQLKSNELSIRSFLSLIRSKLEYQLNLARKVELVDAVIEISMQQDLATNSDGTVVSSAIAWLSPEYAEILRDQELIRKEFKLRAKSLEYLSGIITDLFMDWNQLLSRDARSRIPKLHDVILDNNFEHLVEMFIGK